MYFVFYLLAVCGQQTEIMEIWAQLQLSININDIDLSLGSEMLSQLQFRMIESGWVSAQFILLWT